MEQIKRDIENENIKRFLSKKVRIASMVDERLVYPNGNYINTKVYKAPKETLVTRRRNIITPYIGKNGSRAGFDDISDTFSENQLKNRMARVPKYHSRYYYTTGNDGRVTDVFRPKQVNSNRKKILPRGTLDEIFG